MSIAIKNLQIYVGVAAALSVAISASIVLAQSPRPTQNALIPQLMLPYGAGWSGGIDRGNGSQVPAEDYLPPDYLNGADDIDAAIARGVPAEKVQMYLQLRIFGHYIPPASGLGLITDDPKRPYFNNAMQRVLGIKSSVRIADLTNEAAKNLQAWALEALKNQNTLAAVGKNTQTRQARCWELGVPNFNEVPQPLYFIQTPDEVVMYMGHRVRHIYMNVSHSKNLQPTWYGESVGHYEDDTLVVDTIGQNDKTFVDGYRTPHTTRMHVVERYRVINSGKGLETSFTVDDPDTFHQPWSGRRPRYVVTNHPLNDTDRICAAGNDDVFNLGLDPLQKASTPDF